MVQKRDLMDNNKGFTLVELIVVIVILGILAAMLIPALLGYIDKAKGQQVLLNAKSVYTAAQADLSSAYAKNADLDARYAANSAYAKDIVDTADVAEDASLIVIGTKLKYDGGEEDKAKRHKMYTVNYVYYKTSKGEEIVFDGDAGEWRDAVTTDKKAASDSQYFLIYSK